MEEYNERHDLANKDEEKEMRKQLDQLINTDIETNQRKNSIEVRKKIF